MGMQHAAAAVGVTSGRMRSFSLLKVDMHMQCLSLCTYAACACMCDYLSVLLEEEMQKK